MDPINLIVLLLIFILISIVTIGLILMASAQAILTAQATETAAIVALAGRIGNSSGITTTEADQILSNVTTNTDAINAIAPATP